ncbi:MAG: type II secretion system F family protein [Firmicutes bacterium]|nr:type II secretion system F family protein [Bacillota bacterium]
MPVYNYTAINMAGKQVKGSLEASTLEMAKHSLRGAGNTILEIKEQNALNRDIEVPFLGKPKAKDLALFCRQFVSILRAGVSISAVLGMLGQQTENKKLTAAILDMQSDIEKGSTLAEAMRRQSQIFPVILVNMVAAGEESGNLEDSFRQMETYFDKANRAKAAVSKAMIYPCVLMAVMVVVLIVMMTKIIPTFLQTFTENSIELPFLTQCVMAVSDWFVAWWWLLSAVLIALVVGGIYFSKTNKGKHFFGWWMRKIPVVKQLTNKSACATFCRTLSLLLGSGVNLTESLALVAGNMSNIYFEEAVTTIKTLVSEGWSLRAALDNVGLFSPMVCNLTGIGEETGDLQDMLAKTADYYDDEVDDATKKLLAMMEPCIILFMAVFVVIIVLSIFLPMMSMTSAYDNLL